MRDRNKSKDLLQSFRESRKQIQDPIEVSKSSKGKASVTSQGFPEKKDPYIRFLGKYDNLEEFIDSFSALDMVFYFREKAQESGVKYIIANRARDTAVLKKAITNYSSREVCLMIEFLFQSNQNYLDKENIRPTILVSAWCNTIMRDSLLWVNDEYEPQVRKTTKAEAVKKREWQREVVDEVAKIGEWE